MPEQSETTQILRKAAGGDAGAVEALFPVVYDELRRMAQSYLSGQRGDQTLQATALVHEAYLKLIDQSQSDWNDRAHFFGVAARAIKHVLIDHARSKGRLKRWGGQQRVPLDDVLSLGEAPDTNIWALTRALEKLGREHPEKSRVVEMRFFGGLKHEEIAEVLGVTVRTVERYWRFGRAWLFRELADTAAGDAG